MNASAIMTNSVQEMLRRKIATYGICGGIRVVALNCPSLDLAAILAAAHELGLNPATVRIQVARARGRSDPSRPRRPAAKVEGAVVMGREIPHRAQALAEIERCRQIALARWNAAPTPRILWSKRGTAAGHALGDSEINLNEHFAIKEGAAFLRTVAHEYAHCVVAAMWSKRLTATHGPRPSTWRAHGSMWRAVFRSFGFEPSRCHNYASANDFRKAVAACNCGEHRIGPVRASRMRIGATQYRCRKCNGLLSLV